MLPSVPISGGSDALTRQSFVIFAKSQNTLRAKKSYGQHFLTNEKYAERIADSLRLTDQYDTVFEVGPGQGMLTKYLLDRSYTLKVIEADDDMVDYLYDHYPSLAPNVIRGNFLRVPLEQHAEGQFGLIGNYPYNISSQILIKTIDYRDRIPEMVGMFQKEVADRTVAPPGSKTYGVISVLVQAFYQTEYLFSVAPGNFNPPPKVQSAVIRLERLPDQELGVPYKLFRRVVKTAFGQRRKMLRNTMKSIIPNSERLKDPFFEQRPERLGVAEFVQLSRWIEEEIGND